MALKLGRPMYDDQTPSAGSAMLPPGQYDFTVQKVEVRTSKKNRPGLSVVSVVNDGPQAKRQMTEWWGIPTGEDDSTFFGRQLWRDIHQACPGCLSPDRETLHEEALVGLRFRGTITHEDDPTYGTQPRMKSKRFVAAGSEALAEPAKPIQTPPQKYAQP